MILTMLMALGLAMAGPSEEIEKYEIKLDQSEVAWKGSKVGGSHNGYITIKEGGLEMENDKIKGGNFIMDMTTISNKDLSGDYKQKLENHLKSDDFFGVEKFPTAKFVIKEATVDNNGDYLITGDLTIKETTKSLTFPATVKMEDANVVANAEITVDRSEFDVRYGSDSFFDNLGDKVIYDDFTLTVNLVATK